MYVRRCKSVVTVCRNRSTSQILPPKYCLMCSCSSLGTSQPVPCPVALLYTSLHSPSLATSTITIHFTTPKLAGWAETVLVRTPHPLTAVLVQTPHPLTAVLVQTPHPLTAVLVQTPHPLTAVLVQTPHPLTAVLVRTPHPLTAVTCSYGHHTLSLQ